MLHEVQIAHGVTVRVGSTVWMFDPHGHLQGNEVVGIYQAPGLCYPCTALILAGERLWKPSECHAERDHAVKLRLSELERAETAIEVELSRARQQTHTLRVQLMQEGAA
jgi:hypothetical protein